MVSYCVLQIYKSHRFKCPQNSSHLQHCHHRRRRLILALLLQRSYRGNKLLQLQPRLYETPYTYFHPLFDGFYHSIGISSVLTSFQSSLSSNHSQHGYYSYYFRRFDAPSFFFMNSFSKKITTIVTMLFKISSEDDSL